MMYHRMATLLLILTLCCPAAWAGPGKAGKARVRVVKPSPGRPWITRPLKVTRGQRRALKRGDLGRFWRSRLGQDPVARIGVALWGSEKELRRAIDSQHAGYWQPQPGLMARAALLLKAPGAVRTKPKSKAELVAYWRWLGDETKGRVLTALQRRDKKRGSGDARSRDNDVRAIGRALARAHARSVREDLSAHRGSTPGLLTPRQVMAYHHEVFAAFGLPRTTYGGTPLFGVPHGVQLWAASGIYAHDAER